MAEVGVAGEDLTTATSTTQESARKPQPPPEPPSVQWTRRWIIFSFWAVIIFLGLPQWVWTTSIRRATLPLQQMRAWAGAEGEECLMFYPLHLRFDAPDFDDSSRDDLALKTWANLAPLASNGPFGFRLDANNETIDVLLVQLQQSQQGKTEASLRSWPPVLDVRYDKASSIDSLAAFISKELESIFQDEQQSISYLLSNTPYSNGRTMSLDAASKASLDARTTRAYKYASTYHLTFSLFTSSATPSAWDIDGALERYITPLVGQLSKISNFTVDTQVQLHASFSPSIAGPQFDRSSGKWQLEKTDLSGFVNAAEWPLNPSIGAGPTINFVLYVPSTEHSPLVVAETGSTSWLVPQWGGVQIYNPDNTQRDVLTAEDLEPVMLTFANQLTALIGMPPAPSSLPLRLASLTRERTISLIISASSTLGALARLTLKLTSIAIPDSVAKSVDETIRHLEHACSDLHEGRFESALENARIANDEAERAFFEPSMVGQVYFPEEHKFAVYVPLLGPMSVALVMAGLKELRKLRARKVKAA